MAEINICNSAGRDAVVNLETVVVPLRVRWIDSQHRQATSIRVLKAPLDRDLQCLIEQCEGIANVAPALIHGDPEIDLESVGTLLTATSRVYVNSQRQIVHRIQLFEIVRNPDGSQRERRARAAAQPNVTGEIPLRWSGVFVKRSEAIKKFVFANKLQLTHINGLTYDFLYNISKELEAKDSMMLLGGGAKSNEPLILRRGSVPYRGFLEGRTRADKYSLVLHLSNLELKLPPATTKAESNQA